MPRRRATQNEPSASQVVVPLATSPEGPKTTLTKAPGLTRRTRKRSAERTTGTPPAPVITHEEIASLAYSYWEARQSPYGSADDDWFRAERELRAWASSHHQ